MSALARGAALSAARVCARRQLATSSATAGSLKVMTKAEAAALEGWGFRPNATSGPNTCALKGRHLSQANGVLTGVWESTPGSFDVLNRENTETIYVLAGKLRLTDLNATGEPASRVLAAGDSAVLECGSSVRWEVLETVQKFFVISPKAMTDLK
jgi:uncharacterized cupin superfamily protein